MLKLLLQPLILLKSLPLFLQKFDLYHNDVLFKYSRYRILIPQKEKTEKIATFYSQLSFQYVLSIIYSLLYKKYQQSHMHDGIVRR